MTMIKICGMTDINAVRSAVDAGADAIGFVFAPSVRRVTPQQASDMTAQVPGHVRKVAVMLHPTPEEWQRVFEEFGPDVLQTDAEDFANLQVADSIERWPVLREGGIASNDELPDTYLYEGKDSGTGQTVNWQLAAGLARRGRMILAGGLSAANVGRAIRDVQPFGVDVSSAVESQPGQKDEAKIRAFIDAARKSERAEEEATE
ncbi:MAG: phosphoribosylanthranilate isomerase [Woeseiaceae bacterium]|jgi:phosphoribosylanthranilate isomerase